MTAAPLKSALLPVQKIAPEGIQSNENEIMKIPEIIINPPWWVAMPICGALGLLYVGVLIVGKNLVQMIP